MVAKEGVTLMTIYDIAKEAGVSASTVSRVLNNRPGINKDTRDKVLKIIKEHNFSVSEAARGLVNKNTNMVGILVSDIRNQHHIEGAYMISQHLIEKGYCSILMNAGESDESKAQYVEILASRRVNALMLIGSTFQCEAVENAIAKYMAKIPVIFQNGYFSLPNVSSVLTDELSGTMDAVNYLYAQGRRKIAFINNNDTPSNRKKLKGYEIAVGERNLPEYIIPACPDSAEGGAEATEKLLSIHPDVDAIVYSVDILAVGGSRYLLDIGKKIPLDIALIGTDNSPYSKISNPRLSTIDSKLGELSRSCYEILMKAIEDSTYVEHKVIMPTLVLRETT